MTKPIHRVSTGLGLAALSAILLGTPAAASSVYGPLCNFDVVNDTGDDTCGFEIEIEDVHGHDIYRTFDAPYIRYGTPEKIDTPTGVIIRYRSAWNPATQTFLQRTPPAAPGYVPASDSCWTGGLGAGYAATGCEHFGISQTTQPGATRYRWLSCGPDGTTPPLPELGLPSPAWSVAPGPGQDPMVRAEFEIPNPEGAPYGEPYWVKIYKTERGHAAVLEDLLMENPDVADADTEIEWELLQARPGDGMAFNEAPLGAGAEAVIRRYEFFAYNVAWGRTHTFDDDGVQEYYVDHENGEVVACVVDGCNDPTPDEMGDFVGRQIAGFNLAPAAAAAGRVPDGAELLGLPLTLEFEPGGDITLNWDASCAAGDTDYEVYEGLLGDFHSHVTRLCSTGSALNAILTPSADDAYYLVVPRNDAYEGSYGVDSAGTERGQGRASCLSQLADRCP